MSVNSLLSQHSMFLIKYSWGTTCKQSHVTSVGICLGLKIEKRRKINTRAHKNGSQSGQQQKQRNHFLFKGRHSFTQKSEVLSHYTFIFTHYDLPKERRDISFLQGKNSTTSSHPVVMCQLLCTSKPCRTTLASGILAGHSCYIRYKVSSCVYGKADVRKRLHS